MRPAEIAALLKRGSRTITEFEEIGFRSERFL
jgi:hypothetical protein